MMMGQLVTSRLSLELAELPMLQGIAADDLQWLIEHSVECEFPRGSVILDPGNNNKTAYLILSGCLEVRLTSCNTPASAYLDAGNWVGEMSVIEGTKPSATVISDTDCRLLSVSGKTLWSLIDRSHAVARNLLHAFSARVRRDNVLIAESARQQQFLSESAQTDFLTGLRNRRWLDDMFPRLLERCSVNQQPLSVIMFDIDHFKAYNDTHGHLAGDRALQAVACAVRDNLRPTDTAARYGGEEFVVIMSDTEHDKALYVAQRLCSVIRQHAIDNEDGLQLPSVTVSIGLAALRNGETSVQLLAEADAAMYRAKNSGRNQVHSGTRARD